MLKTVKIIKFDKWRCFKQGLVAQKNKKWKFHPSIADLKLFKRYPIAWSEVQGLIKDCGIRLK